MRGVMSKTTEQQSDNEVTRGDPAVDEQLRPEMRGLNPGDVVLLDGMAEGAD